MNGGRLAEDTVGRLLANGLIMRAILHDETQRGPWIVMHRCITWRRWTLTIDLRHEIQIPVAELCKP